MSWTITPVTAADPAARAMQREYLVDIISRYYGRPATETDVGTTLADDPTDDLAVFLLAFCDGALAGCAGIGVLGPGVSELKRVYVRSSFRGRGGGAALMAAVERYAGELGARLIRLDTRADLVEARALYARHGSREIPAYNDSEYAQHFEKELA